MRKTLVINAVGLTPALLETYAELATPARALMDTGRLATIREVTPAVTCAAQTTYLTGKLPQEHGIVGNGWYFRDTCEIRFWHQSNKLIRTPLLWDHAREIDPTFTVANVCWWYAMYSGCDYTVTPRPMYPADGRKIPDCWTHPAGLRDELQSRLGTFPLFKFWGPMTSIESSRWIASAAIEIDRRHHPTLTLVYLPHLDYCLQKFPEGDPQIASDFAELMSETDRLIRHFQREGAQIVLLSEYGISPAKTPVHPNRVLRQQGLLNIRRERGLEMLDAGASAAFAVADHQVAHVYLNDQTQRDRVTSLLRSTPGIDAIYVGSDRREIGLDHHRAGDIVALAAPGAWFTYYYWLDDALAPDFARTVDIHRKPGYDPAELFIDPSRLAPKLRIAAKLLARKLGFRSLLDVTPLDAGLVKGTHGRPAADRRERPLLIGDAACIDHDEVNATDVSSILLRHLTR